MGDDQGLGVLGPFHGHSDLALCPSHPLQLLGQGPLLPNLSGQEKGHRCVAVQVSRRPRRVGEALIVLFPAGTMKGVLCVVFDGAAWAFWSGGPACSMLLP